MKLLRALRHRSFALLWAGQTLSRVGDFVYEIALAWWVLEATGSAATMSLVLIFAITPSVLFSLVGGLVVDRLPRLPLMLASDAVRALVALTLAALAYAGRLEVWHVFTASLLFGLVDAFFQPAYAALLPQIVPVEDLPSANALTSMSVNLGRVGGPALGALLITQWGTATAFLINGLSFTLSGLLLAPLLAAAIPRPVRAAGAVHPLRDLREGFATVLSTPWLWISILIFALANVTLNGPFFVSMPFLVSDNLHADVDTLGLLYAVFPIGFVLSGLWFGRYTRLRRRGLLVHATTALAAVMLGLFGLVPPLWVLLLAALINGAALEAGHLAWLNLLQEKVPNEQLGRVVSIDAAGSFGLLPVGYALAGWATGVLGAPAVFAVSGGFTALVALLALAQPSIRHLD